MKRSRIMQIQKFEKNFRKFCLQKGNFWPFLANFEEKFVIHKSCDPPTEGGRDDQKITFDHKGGGRGGLTDLKFRS